MHIEYLDVQLGHAVAQPHPPAGWTDAEVFRLRLLVQCLLAASRPSDLFNMRVLRLQQHPDDQDSATTALSARRPLTVAFKAHSKPLVAVLDTVTARTESP